MRRSGWDHGSAASSPRQQADGRIWREPALPAGARRGITSRGRCLRPNGGTAAFEAVNLGSIPRGAIHGALPTRSAAAPTRTGIYRCRARHSRVHRRRPQRSPSAAPIYSIRVHPLPFHRPAELVQVMATDDVRYGRGTEDLFDQDLLRSWRTGQSAFTDFTAYSEIEDFMRRHAAGSSIDATLVDGHFFSTLGVTVTIGRTITLADGCPAPRQSSSSALVSGSEHSAETDRFSARHGISVKRATRLSASRRRAPTFRAAMPGFPCPVGSIVWAVPPWLELDACNRACHPKRRRRNSPR